LYTYAHNNPLKYTDPTGHFVATITGAILGGLIGGVTAAVQGTDVWSGVAGGAVNGAIVGGAIDITVATGGTATTLIAATIVAGGVGGATGDYVNQVGNNFASGKSFEDSIGNVNMTSVFVSAGIGATSGALSGATNIALTAFENGTKKLIQQIATNALNRGDEKVINTAITNAHQVAIRTAQTSTNIDFTTSIIYNSAQNTITYMINDEIVTSIELELNQSTIPKKIRNITPGI
jgi:hypothetical protein